jgi:uncharacterized protein (TIGR01244 family)
MRTIAALAISGLALAGSVLASQDQAAPDIRAFMQITPEFCSAGQPRPEHFAELKTRGVKMVLNLRPPAEHRAEEEQQAVAAAGLKYVNIPVVYRDPQFEQAEAFLKVTDDPANRPMFFHCTAAIRAGAFWMIRRIVRDKWSWDDALAEARKVGLVNAPHLEEFVKAYVSKHGGHGGRGGRGGFWGMN